MLYDETDHEAATALRALPCDLQTEWMRAGPDWLRQPWHHLSLELDGEVRRVADKPDSVEDVEPVEPVKRTRQRKPIRLLKREGVDDADCEVRPDGTVIVRTGKPVGGYIDVDRTTASPDPKWN